MSVHSSTLHMFPQFFANKPVERLIGPGICADDLNDDVLGRCLDALFDADVSTLYQVVAAQVVERLGLKSTAVHLDITSFHVDGAYDNADGDALGKLQLVRGYSRDHRPELNQVILELICENQAGLPVYMQALSGNSNDTKAFAQTVRRHLSSLKAAQESRYLVGDAALYCAETLQLLEQQAATVCHPGACHVERGQTGRGNDWHPVAGCAGQWLSWLLAIRPLCRRRAALVAGAQRTGQPSRAADPGKKPAQREHPRTQSLRQIVCPALCLPERCRDCLAPF